jgi:metal-responsive CopG/Arc/MetJ family transcriptional regulator
MSKKVLVALPPSLLEKIDFAAQAASRTRSDLIRESLRRYIDNFNRQRLLNSTASNVVMLEDTFAKSPEVLSCTTQQD